VHRLPTVVQKRRNAYCPVLDAKNAILELYFLGQSRDALERYEALEQPSAEDHLWAAQCLLALDRPVEAFQKNVQARNLGLEDAGAFAAFPLCVMGEVDRAERTLDSLEPKRLSVFGRAVAARERGGIAMIRGQYRRALSHFEQAWELAAQDALGSKRLASFTGALAFALSKLGRDALALQYLNRALEDASDAQRPRLLYLRTLAYLYTGALSEARADLANLEAFEAAQNTQTVNLTHRQYLHGVLARAQGLPTEAIQSWTDAAARAKASGEQEFEFYATLNLTVVKTGQDELDQARAHLLRARGLAQNPLQHALVGLRHGAVLARAQDADAIPVLEATLQAFSDLMLEREIGLTHLHLAEACLRTDQADRGLDHLSYVIDARHALGSGAVFAVELAGLPVTLEVLQAQPQGSYLRVLLQDLSGLERGAANHIEICTLGRYGVCVNGNPVKLEFGTARTVELIAFLLERDWATLEELQTNVFDGVSPARARNHFHVIRNALGKSVPGLSVAFEPVSKTYRLAHPGSRLTWDALEVRRSLASTSEFGVRRALRRYSGAFLYDSESDWALEYRRDLEWRMASCGLQVLEDLFALNRFEACAELAEHLFELTPTNERVAVLLVRSLQELHGFSVGQKRLEGLKQAFASQVGNIPGALLELNQHAQLIAN
jgi:tetratricopeptide (TPR) repeat protein